MTIALATATRDLTDLTLPQRAAWLADFMEAAGRSSEAEDLRNARSEWHANEALKRNVQFAVSWLNSRTHVGTPSIWLVRDTLDRLRGKEATRAERRMLVAMRLVDMSRAIDNYNAVMG